MEVLWTVEWYNRESCEGLSLDPVRGPGMCSLLTVRAACRLFHSCHKNIQDCLCFQFSNRKDRTVTHLCTELLLPDTHGIAQILYPVDSFISCTGLICEFLCSVFSPLVWPLSSLPKLKEGKERKLWICCCSAVRICKRNTFLAGFKLVTAFWIRQWEGQAYPGLYYCLTETLNSAHARALHSKTSLCVLPGPTC